VVCQSQNRGTKTNTLSKAQTFPFDRPPLGGNSRAAGSGNGNGTWSEKVRLSPFRWKGRARVCCQDLRLCSLTFVRSMPLYPLVSITRKLCPTHDAHWKAVSLCVWDITAENGSVSQAESRTLIQDLPRWLYYLIARCCVDRNTASFVI